MADVESKLGIKKADSDGFRETVVHRIAAWSMDNKDNELSYEEIFADVISGLNDAFYSEKRKRPTELSKT